MTTAHRDDAKPKQAGTSAGNRLRVDEAEFVQQLIRGDDAAWRIFLAHYRRLVTAASVRIAQHFHTRYAIEDDEVFCSLLSALLANDMQKLRAFDPAKGCSFRSWISRLTVHLTWDKLREARRRNNLGEQFRQLNDEWLEADLGRRVIVREDCERLAQAFDGLGKTEKRFFDLFYLECAEANDIADAMHISVKTVYTRHHKVRRKLRAALERDPPARKRRTDVRSDINASA